jgi:hypothetical protein
MCDFCSLTGAACAVCGGERTAGSLAGQLAAVNRRLDACRAEVAALERERASLRDRLGLRPDDGSDQPKLFEADQPSLFGAGVAFEV